MDDISHHSLLFLFFKFSVTSCPQPASIPPPLLQRTVTGNGAPLSLSINVSILCFSGRKKSLSISL